MELHRKWNTRGTYKQFATLSSIYTHVNILKKKSVRKHCKENELFQLFPQFFSQQSVSYNGFIAIFQLSSAPSLNLGLSRNGILGNGLKSL